MYIGDLKNNELWHGKGAYIFPNGNIFKGMWKDGKTNGWGVITFTNGSEIEELWSSGNLIYSNVTGEANDIEEIDYCEGKYKGRLNNNKPHGHGTLCLKDGSTYIGNWKDGVRDGNGIYIDLNGAKYNGEFEFDKPHGKGVLYNSNGEKYDGEWKKGKHHGKGIFNYLDGSQYKGSFKDGMRHGKGIYHYSNGEIYIGGWENDKAKGAGIFSHLNKAEHKELLLGTKVFSTDSIIEGIIELRGNVLDKGARLITESNKFENGSTYKGEFNDSNQYHGYGFLLLENGRRYLGEFINDRPSGQGTLIHPGGESYEGEWRDGNQNGQGTLIYPGGERYEGEWRDGSRNGQGTLIYPDGKKYEGEWKDGSRNGQGTLIYPDGKKYEGEWKDGSRNGQGSCIYPDGKRYEGEWKDGSRNGQGTLIYPGGERYEGEWRDNHQNGQGTLTYPNGDKYAGKWIDEVYFYDNFNIKNSRPVIYYQGEGIASVFKVIKYSYGSKEGAPEECKMLKISAQDEPEFNIEDYIKRDSNDAEERGKTKGKNQIVLFIDVHGGKNGEINNLEEVEKLLKKLNEKITAHNNKSAEGKKINKIKINLLACHGDRCINTSFRKSIINFVSSGIAVRTSAGHDSSQSSSFIFNGKNKLPLATGINENPVITERIFSPNKSDIEEFTEGKKSKYRDITTKDPELYEDILIWEASGNKIYNKGINDEGVSGFFEDDYDRPKGSEATSPDAKPLKAALQANHTHPR